MHSELGLPLAAHEFKSWSGHNCVTTLGNLYTPVCLCHQSV